MPTVEESLKIVAENPRLLTQPFKWSCLLTSSQPKATVPPVARAVMDMLDGKTVGISREVPFAVAKSITEALAEEAKATYRAGPTKLPGFDDTQIFLYHKSHRPPGKVTLNPKEDAVDGMYALLVVEQEFSYLNRGWELAVIKSAKNKSKGTVHLGYLAPASCNTGSLTVPWPSDWMRSTLQPFRIKTPKRYEYWEEPECDVDCIQFLFTPNKKKTIPEGIKASLQGQIEQIEAAWREGKDPRGRPKVVDSLPGAPDDDDDEGECLCSEGDDDDDEEEEGDA